MNIALRSALTPLENLKVGTRLGFGFGITILLAIVVGVITTTYLKSLSELTYKLYQHPFAVSTAALRIEGSITSMHRFMKDVALAKSPTQIDAAAAKVTEIEARVFKDFDIINERFLGEKQKISKALQAFTDWKPIRDQVIALMREDKRSEAAAITKEKGADHVAKLYQMIQEFTEFATNKADEFVTHAELQQDHALRVIYIIMGISIGLAVLLSYVVSRIACPI